MMNLFANLVYFGMLLFPQNSSSTLEQLEAAITGVAELGQPAVVRVTVKRSSMESFDGSFYTPQIWNVPEPETPEMPEEDYAVQEDLELLRQEAEQLREEARQMDEEARRAQEELNHAMRQSADALRKSQEALQRLPNKIAFTKMLSPLGHSRSIGSGFLLENNYVVTTYAVAGKGGDIAITTRDGRELQGNLVGSDETSDLALIQVQGENLPHLTLAQATPSKVGSVGIFLSRSYGNLENVNFGFITGMEERENGEPMVRMNFPILPGESGAPLLNAHGEVIGIASANLRQNWFSVAPSPESDNYSFSVTAAADSESAQRFSYFIPAQRVQKIIKELQEYGSVRRAYFGVSGGSTITQDAEGNDVQGVMIWQVYQNTAAEEAGLKEGDILLVCAGKPVDSFAKLAGIISGLEINKPVTIVVRRNAQILNLEVIPQERPRHTSWKDHLQRMQELGIAAVPKSKELVEFLGLEDAPEGYIVSAVTPNSSAEKIGIKRGDLLIGYQNGKLTVWREGEELTFELK